jgi:hypothetical protein
MIHLLCRNRVRDFAKWKRVFDSRADAHRGAGLTLTQLWCSIDNPRNVFFLFEVSDIERARKFVGAPESAEAGRGAGMIEGEYHFLESDVAKAAAGVTADASKPSAREK